MTLHEAITLASLATGCFAACFAIRVHQRRAEAQRLAALAKHLAAQSAELTELAKQAAAGRELSQRLAAVMPGRVMRFTVNGVELACLHFEDLEAMVDKSRFALREDANPRPVWEPKG